MITVAYVFNGLLVGGMERQFVEQARLIDRARFRIVLITLFSYPARADFFDRVPPDVVVHRLAFRGWWDFREWRKLYRTLSEVRPNLIVSSLFFANTAARLMAPRIGAVSIAREHNTYVSKPFSHRLIDRWLAKRSYCIAAVSATVADFTAEQEGISRSKFRVIHNGIDLRKADEALAALPAASDVRRELGMPDGAIVVLTVSRLTSQKNIRALISGFGEAHGKEPRLFLALVGDGSLRQELESHADSAGLTDAVRFYGMRDDVWKFYKAADLYASASFIEGFSNSYLEALAAGVPIVATKTAGTDEFLVEGENGHVIEGTASRAVADALGRALAGAREGRRREARKTAERFTIERAVTAYEALFIEAVPHG